jgi:hypothetical protein
MADAALFIGWGQVVRAREKRAVQVSPQPSAHIPDAGGGAEPLVVT